MRQQNDVMGVRFRSRPLGTETGNVRKRNWKRIRFRTSRCSFSSIICRFVETNGKRDMETNPTQISQSPGFRFLGTRTNRPTMARPDVPPLSRNVTLGEF